MRAPLLLIALAACTSGASSDPGLDAILQIPGAQFRPGPFPAANGGPAVHQVLPHDSMVTVGSRRTTVAGDLEATARSAILGIEGFDGAWIVPAGPAPQDAPQDASLAATLGIARTFPPGPFVLLVAAGDAAGRIGEAGRADMVAVPADAPAGDLVVSLVWEGRADLDLHVVDGAGQEAWSQHPNTWQTPPPGQPPAGPDDWATGGVLDQDANKDCHRDGAPQEDVVWTTRTGSMGQDIAPIIPDGRYVVRVDTVAMCGAPSQTWTAFVYSQGSLLGTARGTATAADASVENHGDGAGVTALCFQMPDATVVGCAGP